MRYVKVYLNSITGFSENFRRHVGRRAAHGEQRLPHRDGQAEVGQLQGLGELFVDDKQVLRLDVTMADHSVM